jgi:F0F1-type ATP synthase assembly protein I
MAIQNRDVNVWAQAGRYASLGFKLPVSACVGYGMGYLLDRLFHTGFLAIVFLGLGTVSGFIELIRSLNAAIKRDER